LTIVSVGTSLPEFVTSVMAIRKGYDDIAIGNIVGSNIFNIFFVLAFSAVIYPLPFASANIIDTFFVILATLMLFIVLFIGKRHIVERWAGVTFLTTYAGFLVFILIRG
jgi:cation:H+ antiporter